MSVGVFLWLMHFQFLPIWLMLWGKIELFLLLHFQRSLNRYNLLTLRVLWIFIPHIDDIALETHLQSMKLKLHATMSSSEFVQYFHVLFINLYLSYFEQVELFFCVFWHEIDGKKQNKCFFIAKKKRLTCIELPGAWKRLRRFHSKLSFTALCFNI